ncbi:hypothetical protein DITRI_Ditri19aG0049600 [Diplodiscus trichospermus]
MATPCLGPWSGRGLVMGSLLYSRKSVPISNIPMFVGSITIKSHLLFRRGELSAVVGQTHWLRYVSSQPPRAALLARKWDDIQARDWLTCLGEPIQVPHGQARHRKQALSVTRGQFVTRISKYMAGNTLLVWHKQVRRCGWSAETATHSVDGETDVSGTYQLKVEGDHEEEICEVALVESSDPECAEIDKENYLKKSARIGLTRDNGITSDSRLANANPLGFMVKKRWPECAEVLRELGITSSGLV